MIGQGRLRRGAYGICFIRARIVRSRRSLPFLGLTLLLSLYHQWLGERFSNPYFSGDAGAFIAARLGIINDYLPRWLVFATSKSPVSLFMYELTLRLFHITSFRKNPASAADAAQAYTLKYAVWLSSPHLFTHLLAALATVICVLTGLLAWRFTASRTVACLSLLLAGLYAPFVISSERALTEMPTTVVLLLTLLALREAIICNSPVFGALTGGCIFLLIAARTQYASPILALTVILLLGGALTVFLRRHRRRGDQGVPDTVGDSRRLRMLGAMALVLILFLSAGWLYVQQAPPDERLGSLPSDLVVQQTPFAYVDTDGWAADRIYIPFSAHPSLLERNAALLFTGRRPMCRFNSGPYLTIICLSLQSPTYAIESAARNEYRLWWFPHNDFHVSAGRGSVPIVSYHRFLIVAGLLGLILLALRRREALFLLLPGVVIAVLFSMQHIEVRYALPAMPSFAIGAGVLVAAVYEEIARAVHRLTASGGLRARLPSVRLSTFVMSIGGAVSFGLLVGSDRVFMIHGATRAAVLLTRIMPLVALSGIGLALLYRKHMLRRWSYAVPVGSAAIVFALAAIPALSTSSDEWSVALTDPQQQLTQKIVLPKPPSAAQQFAILIDLRAPDGDLSDLAITLNGHDVQTAEPAYQPRFLTQEELIAYHTWDWDESHGQHNAATIAQWVAFPVPTEWAQAGENDIGVRVRTDGPRLHSVTIFGQYGGAADHQLTMPSLFETSLWKYDFNGDVRIAEPMTLASAVRYSLYSHGETTSQNDLSPAWGIQRGTYRIFLGTLNPAHYPDAASVPSGSLIQARVNPAAGSGAFWFYASATPNTRLTLLDASGVLASFTGGTTTQQRWTGERADIMYIPISRVDGGQIASSGDTDPLSITAPVQAALQQWRDMRPPERRTSQSVAVYTGVYMVQLHQGSVVGNLTMLTTLRAGALGSDWATIVPSREIRPGAGRADVYVYMPLHAIDNVGSMPDLPADEPTGFFMLHTGILPPASILGQATPVFGGFSALSEMIPLGATYMRQDRTPSGVLNAFWSLASEEYARTFGSVFLTLN